MSSFRTVLPPRPAGAFIRHQDRLLCIGSCFAEHIGDRLRQAGFRTLINPSGILFDPLSIARALDGLLDLRTWAPADLVFQQGLWHSFDHHSRFSAPEPGQVLEAIREAAEVGGRFLVQSSRLLITFGTASVHERADTGALVANCHKFPGDFFRRRRLTVEEIRHGMGGVISRLRERMPELEILLSVSPVRYLREGFIGNQRSKAVLLLAAEALEQDFPFVHYYPAYELLVDDLRDYRFYAADMLHPAVPAVDYIWSHFSQSFFDEPTRQLQEQVEALGRAARHRPFHAELPEHQAFLGHQMERLSELQQKHPFLDLSEHRQLLEIQRRV